MGVPVIRIDAAATRRRVAKLRRYVDTHLIDGDEFVCPHYADCLGSLSKGLVLREGTMSHVGRRYDLLLDGKPLRVMVVGQESGWPKTSASEFSRMVTLDARYRQVHNRSGLQHRYYAQAPNFPGRNPHMRGTTSALRLLFGKGLGAKPRERVHRASQRELIPSVRRVRFGEQTPVLGQRPSQQHRSPHPNNVQSLQRALRRNALDP